MKKTRLSLLFASLSLLTFSSCNQPKQVKTQMDAKHTICYIAIDRTDTAWLKIDTADKQILGELEFHYSNKNRYVGPVKALVKGDTIKGNYSFQLNNINKWYKNPIALLKKDNTLTMGVGEVMMLWGSGYFDKKVPIDYDKGRFVFQQAGCLIN